MMPRKRRNSGSGKYEVGYRRPPKQYQFKPGQITNPDGINQTTARSTAQDLKASFERELNKKVKISKGKQNSTVTQGAAGIGELVRQYAKGDHRARRDVFALADKFGVDIGQSRTIENALAEAVSAEDEALLEEYVQHHLLIASATLDTYHVLASPTDAGSLVPQRRKMLSLPKSNR